MVEHTGPVREGPTPPRRQRPVLDPRVAEHPKPAEREHGALVQRHDAGVPDPALDEEAQRVQSDDLLQLRARQAARRDTQPQEHGQRAQCALAQQQSGQVPYTGAPHVAPLDEAFRQRALPGTRGADELDDQGPQRGIPVWYHAITIGPTGWP